MKVTLVAQDKQVDKVGALADLVTTPLINWINLGLRGIIVHIHRRSILYLRLFRSRWLWSSHWLSVLLIVLLDIPVDFFLHEILKCLDFVYNN